MSDGPYRTPGNNGDLPPGFWRCAECRGAMHPLNNCRRRGDKFICMPCYEKAYAAFKAGQKPPAE